MRKNRRKGFLSAAIVLALTMLVSLCLAAGCSPSVSEDPNSSSEGRETPSAAEEQTFSQLGLAEWSESGDCEACHRESHAQGTVAAVHEGQAACGDCHAGSGLSQAHSDIADKTMADAEKVGKLKLSEVGDDACIVCHEESGLASRTASSTALTDDAGSTVNPHDVPSNTYHDDRDIGCVDCHRYHKTIDENRSSARNECLSCHHTGEYSCGGCHLIEE